MTKNIAMTVSMVAASIFLLIALILLVINAVPANIIGLKDIYYIDDMKTSVPLVADIEGADEITFTVPGAAEDMSLEGNYEWGGFMVGIFYIDGQKIYNFAGYAPSPQDPGKGNRYDS